MNDTQCHYCAETGPTARSDLHLSGECVIERNEDGFVVDENGQGWGHCNACGEEVAEWADCCVDGEVVP